VEKWARYTHSQMMLCPINVRDQSNFWGINYFKDEKRANKHSSLLLKALMKIKLMRV
jgi:hypothetical protein